MFLCPIHLYILLAREFACDDKLDDRDAFLSGEIIKIRKEIGEGKIQWDFFMSSSGIEHTRAEIQ